MSEANKAIVRRLSAEGFGAGDLSVLDELLADDYVDHFAPPGVAPGREGTKAFAQMMHAAFSDVEITVDDLLADGDRVASRWTMTATHVGEFMDIPASNKRISIAGIEIDRIADGKVAEAWTQVDMVAFLMQAGVIPEPG